MPVALTWTTSRKGCGPDGLKDLFVRNKLALYAFSVYAGGYAHYAELLGRAGGGVAVMQSAPDLASPGTWCPA